MKNIGFSGGSSICELGPTSDVILFFDCLRRYVQQRNPSRDISLLTDRLYRHYLRLEELDLAEGAMKFSQAEFANVLSSVVDWETYTAKNPGTRLDYQQPTLAGVFSRYFDLFSHCVESAKLNYAAFKDYPGYSYEPVKTVVSDMPDFMLESKRKLSDYDALKGEPFWLL